MAVKISGVLKDGAGKPVQNCTCNQVNHLIPTRLLVKGGEITCKMLK
ncbi:TPA: prophage tail fiber N-terminal domain-containing protein [Escherichia coli]